MLKWTQKKGKSPTIILVNPMFEGLWRVQGYFRCGCFGDLSLEIYALCCFFAGNPSKSSLLRGEICSHAFQANNAIGATGLSLYLTFFGFYTQCSKVYLDVPNAVATQQFWDHILAVVSRSSCGATFKVQVILSNLKQCISFREIGLRPRSFLKSLPKVRGDTGFTEPARPQTVWSPEINPQELVDMIDGSSHLGSWILLSLFVGPF